MSNALNKCKAEETAACCCVDVGTVIDNQVSDCEVVYQHVFATKADAESMLDKLVKKAKEIESDPCKIDSQMKEVGKEVELHMTFLFSCAAEALIFQLALR